jgi:hypothetical protein
MTPNTVAQKVYVNKRKEAALTCPSCHSTRIVNFGQYTQDQIPTKAKCVCGCIFDVPDVIIESRKYYRKKTKLPGSYAKTVVDKIGAMTVKDVSFSGIRFTTDKEHDIEVNEVLGVRFVLDDTKQTEIRRTVTVKNVQGRVIGAEFCDTHGYDLDLIYYLMLT